MNKSTNLEFSGVRGWKEDSSEWRPESGAPCSAVGGRQAQSRHSGREQRGRGDHCSLQGHSLQGQGSSRAGCQLPSVHETQG